MRGEGLPGTSDFGRINGHTDTGIRQLARNLHGGTIKLTKEIVNEILSFAQESLWEMGRENRKLDELMSKASERIANIDPEWVMTYLKDKFEEMPEENNE